MTAATVMPTERETRRCSRVHRTTLHDAIDGRLYFAQVREDPVLEIDALGARAGGSYVVVSSGGCTALSLLARGADEVVAVDMNATQNHVTELKAAALVALGPVECAGFLGGYAISGALRLRRYALLRPHLSLAAVRYWDANRGAIERGVLRSGVSEKFIAFLATLVRATVHPQRRIDRLLSCTTVKEQARFYEEEWNSVRWRTLFRVLLSRRTLKRTYEPGFFSNVENQSFPAHFHGVFERTIQNVPVATNYFLHQMLTGFYPTEVSGGLPPYLASTDNALTAETMAGLELVDGSYQAYLVGCEESSVDGFALSNICEWMSPAEVDSLFESITRVAKPGARVVFRNFVGHTVVPPWLSDVIVEDKSAGVEAITRDRSCVQARIAICTVRKAV